MQYRNLLWRYYITFFVCSLIKDMDTSEKKLLWQELQNSLEVSFA